MKIEQIRHRIIEFQADYEKNKHLTRGFYVIHDFMAFLIDEDLTYKHIKTLVKYSKEQLKLASESDDLLELIIEPKKVPNLPVFKFELAELQEHIDQGKTYEYEIKKCLTIHFTFVFMAYASIEYILQNPDDKSKEEIMANLEFLSTIPTSTLPIKIMSDYQLMNPASDFFSEGVDMTCQFILNSIDHEMMIKKTLPSKALSYDQESKTLHVKGYPVKLVERGHKNIMERLVMELLKTENLHSELDYEDIALFVYGHTDYDERTHPSNIYHTIVRINEKVDNSTNGIISEFIKGKSGQSGRCKIDPEYI